MTRKRDRYRLPADAGTDVSFETDPAVCTRAGTAYHRQWPGVTRGNQVIVLKLGATRYVVEDESAHVPTSEFGAVMVFDDNWRELAAFTS